LGERSPAANLTFAQQPDWMDKPRIAECIAHAVTFGAATGPSATCESLRLFPFADFSQAVGLKSKLESGVPRERLISIVDDDESVGAAIKGLMRSAGFAAESFQSAADFLESSQLGQTSCLITDLHLGQMSGYEMYKRLVAFGMNIPTILITANDDDSIRQRALKAGVICYLIKPFSDNDLLSSVYSALSDCEKNT
jgi:CheY-like chemotaxis protein